MMGWMDRIFGRKSAVPTDLTQRADIMSGSLSEMYAGLSTTSISPETATSIATLYSCVRVIRESMACLAINVYERRADGRYIADKDPAQAILKTIPNSYNTWPELKMLWVSDYLLYGNGYLIVLRDRFAAVRSIHWVKQSEVDPYKDDDGNVWYKVKGFENPFPHYNVLHLRELWNSDIKGRSRLQQHADSLGTFKSIEKMQNKAFSNGLLIGGAVEFPLDAEMDDDALDAIEGAFKKKYSTGKTEVVFLGGGAKFTQFKPTQSFADADIIEALKLGNQAICSIMGVPPHKVGILDKSSYNSFKQLQIDFQSGAILPIAVLMEGQMMKLVAEKGKENKYIKVEVDSILRADPIESIQSLIMAVGNGLMSVNEAREILDRNPIEGGDKYLVPGNNLVDINQLGNNEQGNRAQDIQPLGNER